MGCDGFHPSYGNLFQTQHFAPRPQPHRDAVSAGGLQRGQHGVRADVAAAREIDYPVLVKASAGGGGKGMRVVQTDAEARELVPAARREATAAFGDGTLYVERLIEQPRHVEIQVFGDAHGHAIHLFERECSIQRRHQKILEESPSVAVDEGLRAAAAEGIGRLGKAEDLPKIEKLYNEEQVLEGRRNRDLYVRLKEDIDRSRQIYDERVHESVRGTTDYFHQELVRSLAGGDPRALGL